MTIQLAICTHHNFEQTEQIAYSYLKKHLKKCDSHTIGQITHARKKQNNRASIQWKTLELFQIITIDNTQN